MSFKNGYAETGFVENLYVKQAPYHPFELENNGLVQGAQSVLALPLPFGTPRKPGPYTRGSMGWVQLNPAYQHRDLVAMALQFFSSAFEISDNGTPCFMGQAGCESVRKSQCAFLRMMEGRPRRFDDKLLKHGTHLVHTFMCDPLLGQVFLDIKLGVYDVRLQRAGRRDVADEEDLVDGVGYGMAEEEAGRGGYQYGRGRRRGGGDDDDDEDEEENERAREEAEDARVAALINERVGDREGRHMIEKIKIIVHGMQRPVAPGSAEMEDAGCIIFFCIMDPLYSVGKAFANLLNLCDAYQNHLTGVKPLRALGNRYAGGGRQGDDPDLLRLFPWLKNSDHKTNALHTASRAMYLDMVALLLDKSSISKGADRATNWNHTLNLHHAGTRSRPNPVHPLNVFRVGWALKVMRDYGVPAEQCHYDNFRGANWEAERDAAEFEGIPYEDRWYFDPHRSWHYLLEGWTWARNGCAGLERQYFPWVKVPKELRYFMTPRNPGNALVLWQGHDEGSVLSPEFTSTMIVEGVGRPAVLPTLFFDPNQILRKSAIVQVAREHAQLLATIRGPSDPKTWAMGKDDGVLALEGAQVADVDGDENAESDENALAKKKQPPVVVNEYTAYCKQMQQYREACCMRMQLVLKPDETRIYPSMNVILNWMGTDMKKVGVPLELYTIDPHDPEPATYPLDPFACYMARLGQQVKHFRLISDRIDRWIIVHFGAQDCHSTSKVDIHVSAIFHGLSQAGKSFLVKDALEGSCIEGTVTSILAESDKTWFVHHDNVGMIIFKDEVAGYMVSAKAAENDKTGAAERLKSMTTDQRATYRSLTLIEGSNGRSERKAENIESLFHATMWCCTNKKVGGGDEAIASRFFNFVMVRSEVDLFEFIGINNRMDQEDATIKKDAEHSWRIKQALLALSQVLVDAGTLPPCSMDCFDMIQARVSAYLKMQGIDVTAIRHTQMVKRLATIYTLLNALIHIYDVPGALHADAPVFELRQLLDMIPYMFCTKQIAIFTLTQAEEIFLSPMRAVVLRAAMAYVDFPTLEGTSLDVIIKGDNTQKHQNKWKMIDQGDGKEKKIDFNYIQLTGNYTEICQHVAEFCEPKIGATEVDGMFRMLAADNFIRVRQIPRVASSLYSTLVNGVLEGFEINRDRVETPIKVVTIDFKGKAVYIAVEALGKLHDNLMSDAIAACLYKHWRPQVMLTGTQVRKAHPTESGKVLNYAGIFNTMELAPDVIAEFGGMLDSFDAPDAAYIPPVARTMFHGQRLHPDKKHEYYNDKRTRRTQAVLTITEDLDDWAHEQHHYRAACFGKHTDSISRPLTVYERIRRHLADIEDRHDWNAKQGSADKDRYKNLPPRCRFMDYPMALVAEVDLALKTKKEARPFMLREEVIADALAMEVARWEKTELSKQENARAPKPVIRSFQQAASAVHLRYPVEASVVATVSSGRGKGRNKGRDKNADALDTTLPGSDVPGQRPASKEKAAAFLKHRVAQQLKVQEWVKRREQARAKRKEVIDQEQPLGLLPDIESIAPGAGDFFERDDDDDAHRRVSRGASAAVARAARVDREDTNLYENRRLATAVNAVVLDARRVELPVERRAGKVDPRKRTRLEGAQLDDSIRSFVSSDAFEDGGQPLRVVRSISLVDNDDDAQDGDVDDMDLEDMNRFDDDAVVVEDDDDDDDDGDE